jgi:hypothetical protein
MANFNTLIKQYLWLGLILSVAQRCGGLYLSDLNLSSDEEAPVRANPPGYDRGGRQQLQQQGGAACDHRNAGDCR